MMWREHKMYCCVSSGTVVKRTRHYVVRSGRLNSYFPLEHNEKSVKINHVYATVKRDSLLKIMLL